ncbi:schwannomin-interacting protein 1 isoform X1 [Lates japonicus]|uniref:Schwannomin-interacting protein 1 isoform X1 n=1 Tax=Lates japonicus TaxID=270547 RepID=A0AAD3R7I6_LATJO|nr:schwannomin-interacting protein 1 isoform X1 [Lates japonicus]
MTLAPPTPHSFVFMEDYDVDMDEDEEGEVFMRKATTGHWWEDCGDDGNCDTQRQRGGRGCMVNSRSWAEELQDIFAPQAEDCYSGGRTRLSSISVSD